MNFRQSIGYYLLSSYRRKLLDTFLLHYSHLYKGVVLDIGGRDRGKFRSPKDRAEKWIVVDIEESRKPDIVLDVCDMHPIESNSIDIVNALELFEHVKNPEKGLRECFRVLNTGGTAIISMPFLYPIHADPFDFQRWTENKWQHELKASGFSSWKIMRMGGPFTVLADMAKSINAHLGPFKYLGFLLFPILDMVVSLERRRIISESSLSSAYTTGYFIIAKK